MKQWSVIAKRLSELSTVNHICELFIYFPLFQRCRHSVFSKFFGDEAPKCIKQCDFCLDPKGTESKTQSFFSSDVTQVPSLNMFSDDSDLYGGGRRGQEM